jgi:ubiquinone biosynthesis protein UbiJ
VIVTKDFEVELEYITIQGTVDIDVSSDLSRVTIVGIDDLDKVIQDIKTFVKETIEDDPDYSASVLREQERDWDQASDAEARREDDLIREEDC